MSEKWVLAILDGFGLSDDRRFNGVAQARTPTLDHLLSHYPHTFLQASEAYVGLPSGQMGNSEVGHMTIGSGRIIRQGLSLIDHEIETGNFANHPLFEKLKTSKRCHVMGLFSDGGVHSHLNHFFSALKVLLEGGVEVFLHLFTDGRDTPPKSAMTFLNALPTHPMLKHATIQGRFYGMDRDHRMERTEAAYLAFMNGEGEKVSSFEDAVQRAYAAGVGDEFIPPCVIEGYQGFEEGDAILHMNFRADRVRQLMGVLILPDFDGFKRINYKKPSYVVGLSDYSKTLDPYMEALYPNTPIKDGLVQILSHSGKKVFKIAETEKYAHVTFFFNGGVEEPEKGEERVLIPSPKVATYDLAPEMSAREVTEKLTQAVSTENYDLLVVNYANPDMVGHTGVKEAIVQAIECVDMCLGHLLSVCEKFGYNLMITADHGNAEQMVENGEGDKPHTAHTCNPVPLIVVLGYKKDITLSPGTLADIAPTLLHSYGIAPPSTMTGRCLIS